MSLNDKVVLISSVLLKMLSERDIRVLKVMVPNLSFIITKMVRKIIFINMTAGIKIFYFIEISRTSIKITIALRRIFVQPVQLEVVC